LRTKRQENRTAAVKQSAAHVMDHMLARKFLGNVFSVSHQTHYVDLDRLFVPTDNYDLRLDTDMSLAFIGPPCGRGSAIWLTAGQMIVARWTFCKTRVVRCITCNCDGAEYIYHASSGFRVALLVYTSRKRAEIPLLVMTGPMLRNRLLHVAGFCSELSPRYAFGLRWPFSVAASTPDPAS
jgi:hypothetical protein